MKFTTFLKQMFTSHSGISSKRVCGVIGWFVAVIVLIYCTVYVCTSSTDDRYLSIMCDGIIRN